VDIIDSNTKNQSNAFFLNIIILGDAGTLECQDQSGNEKVVGTITGANLRYFDYLRGQWRYRTYLNATAKNEYKSWWRGWELKNTSALEMVINVNYSYGGTSGSSNVRVHTGGNLFKVIGYNFFDTGWQQTNFGGFYSNGSITFSGRSGTSCIL